VEAETCKRELAIEIPADAVRQEAEEVTSVYRRKAKIPGFRPGKAPAGVIRRHFHDDIRSEVAQALVPKYFHEAVKAKNFSVVGQPRFEDLKVEDGQPLTVKATFEVLPDFELKNYRGLEVEEGTAEVTDADVEKAVEEMKEQASSFEVVTDRPAEDGDFLMVNYKGVDTADPSAPPVEARDATVHLGGDGTVAAFTENLQGTRAADRREFNVPYPEDYAHKSLAGKTLHYDVEVLSVKKKVVPAADDDLAKSVSEFQTFEELRNKLRENLAARKKQQAEAETRNRLLEKLIEAHAFPLPQALVEAQLDRKIERVAGRLLMQHVDPRTIGVDWNKIREDSRPDAEKEVRGSLLLEKIAEAEKIEVSDEELDEAVRELAGESGEAPAALKTRLTREGTLDRIKSTRRNRKALDFIYHSANIRRAEKPHAARAEG
jgi:trigger factor